MSRKSRPPVRPQLQPLDDRSVPAALAAGDGLSAVYFDSPTGGSDQLQFVREFRGRPVAEVVDAVDFDSAVAGNKWQATAGPAVLAAASAPRTTTYKGADLSYDGNTDTFAARFSGRVEAPAPGNYTFRLTADHGARLWIDDKLVVDTWAGTGPTDKTAAFPFAAAGQKANVVVEYAEQTNGSRVKLEWDRPDVASPVYQVVPKAYLYSDNRAFPAGPGVIDVRQGYDFFGTYYQAKGDGLADDTIALQLAFEKAGRSSTMVYLPNGMYRVTADMWVANDIFGSQYKLVQGQNRDGAVIRVDDADDTFQNPSAPLPVLDFLPGPGDGPYQFRNRINDLTVNVGRDNPGAIGLDFHNNNQGGVDNVRILAEPSADGKRRGAIGLRVAQNAGPGLIENVTVDGFSVGAELSTVQYNLVVEDVTVQNQTGIARQVGGFTGSAGIVNGAVLAGRNVEVRNTAAGVPAIYNNGMLTLIESKLTGGGSGAAIVSAKFGPDINGTPAYDIGGAQLFARDVTTAGYPTAVDYELTTSSRVGSNPADVPAPLPAEYASNGAVRFADTALKSIGLPVRDTPEAPWGNPATQWLTFDPAAQDDDTAALQAALNQVGAAGGAHTLYVKFGELRLSGTLTVSGDTRRILGQNTNIFTDWAFAGTTQPLFRFANLTGPDVTFENFLSTQGFGAPPAGSPPVAFTAFEQADADTALVLRRLSVFADVQYRNAAAGSTVFLDDVAGGFFEFSQGQSVFARQVNPEASGGRARALIDVTGAGTKFWGQGVKFEGYGAKFRVRNGATAEVLGWANTTNATNTDGAGDIPAIEVLDSTAFLSGTQIVYGGSQNLIIREVRNGVAGEVRRADRGWRDATWGGGASGANIPAFYANRTSLRAGPDAAADGIPVKVDDFEAAAIGSDWQRTGAWALGNGNPALAETRELRKTGTGEGVARVGNAGWSDYQVEAWVRPTAVGTGAGVIGRAQSATQFYALEVLKTATGFTLTVWKRDGDNWTSLGSTAVADGFNDGWLRVRMRFAGSRIVAEYSDDGLTYSPVTASPIVDTRYAAGLAGLWADGGDARFDDFAAVTV